MKRQALMTLIKPPFIHIITSSTNELVSELLIRMVDEELYTFLRVPTTLKEIEKHMLSTCINIKVTRVNAARREIVSVMTGRYGNKRIPTLQWDHRNCSS